MKVISSQESVHWFRDREILLTERDYPIFHGVSHSIEVPISPDTITGLAYMICEMEELSFQGGVMAFREWNMGSPELDRIGHTGISLMLNNLVLDPENPLYVLFDPSEWLSLQPFFLQPLLFHWDAFYIPTSALFVVFVSHDEVVYFIATKAAMSEQFLKIFERWGAKSVPIPNYLLASTT